MKKLKKEFLAVVSDDKKAEDCVKIAAKYMLKSRALDFREVNEIEKLKNIAK